MTHRYRLAARLLAAAAALGAAVPARAIPAFARKYGTSCLTCHTVYPKLTPFGEAFRRNGYRFPGVDSDYVKQDTVPLGQWVNTGLATPAYGKVTAGVFYGELSYVVFPWMVPAVRVESISLKPSGGASASDLHVMPGIAFLLRPNLKLVVAGNVESASGFPLGPGGTPTAWQGGAADWGAFAASPLPSYTATASKQELESLAAFLAWAI